jgi:hypothetical protein
MTDTIFHTRIIENKDWATLLFLLVFIIIAITRAAFEARFNDFIKLIASDKYIKIYRESGSLVNGFTVLLFIIQILSLAFFIQLILHHFGYVSKNDWMVFIQITAFLFVFILSKYLIEKIIATSFDIEEFIEQFNFQKVSYRSYISLIILPMDLILYYQDISSNVLIFSIIGIVLTTNLLTYILSLKNYQNLLFGKLFYFILYLCTLEIAPYYLMCYWFTENSVY